MMSHIARHHQQRSRRLMPSRNNRNARKNNANNANNDHTSIYQQTPSSRPSPNAYPSPLPDESPASSSTDDLHGTWRGRTNGLWEPQPEFRDSGGPLLAVGHPDPPHSLPTPPIHSTFEEDSTVAWNLEEGDSEEGGISRWPVAVSLKLALALAFLPWSQ
ncbi:hypothetical protein D9758_005560 [Tetrapyrgos nigripes]|uniref:Uncharacterized protein n=1 Tax=Tetrapyrgos nigripes TaxID=182062 RepID=A0A8H5GGS3_9AGAR|nr:hypothetical protein D9758_005560 [Tetrapyrgos nigripes]